MAKQAKKWETIRVSKEDHKKVERLARVRKIARSEMLSLIINHQCNEGHTS